MVGPDASPETDRETTYQRAGEKGRLVAVRLFLTLCELSKRSRGPRSAMKTYIPNLSGAALKRLGSLLILAAPAEVLVGLWVLGRLFELGKPGGGFIESCLGLGFVILVASFLRRTGMDWHKQGKHLSTPRAENLISSDPRPPVLYLRPFQDDSVAAQGEIQYGASAQYGWYELSWVADGRRAVSPGDERNWAVRSNRQAWRGISRNRSGENVRRPR